MSELPSGLEADGEGGRKEPSYLRLAFQNSANYMFLGGAGAIALVGGDWAVAVIAAGLEALWLMFAPDSRFLRRMFFDKMHAEELQRAADEKRRRLFAWLPREEAERIRALEEKRDQIVRLANENEAIHTELLRDELAKVARLTASFVDLVVSARRYQEYLDGVDFDRLERDVRDLERRATAAAGAKGKQPGGPGQERIEGLAQLAQKNLAILMKRREKLAEIRDYVSQAKAQMELIENTFRLLADQIVTMRSPRELSGQLDELMDGVEAVRSTARETEALLEAAR